MKRKDKRKKKRHKKPFRLCFFFYKGYRLVAVSKLPINSSTIVYGSCDAASNVYATNTGDKKRQKTKREEQKKGEARKMSGKRENIK